MHVFHRRFLSLAPVVLLIAASLYGAKAIKAQRSTYSLDQGWRFSIGEIAGASAPAFDDSKWDTINVPHMFPYSVNNDRKDVYRGEAWYRKSFDAPAAWKGQRIFLKFDAVSLVSDVYLNGKQIGEHRGGFAAFAYEITGALNYGAHNQLSVRVDDRMNQDVSPLEISLLYGGIYRHVGIIVTGPVDITPMDNASPGVFLTQTSVTPEKAVVQVRTEVDSNLIETRQISVRLLLIDGSGKPLFKTTAAGPAAGGKITPVTETITVPQPHLWNGVGDPYLYSVRIDLLNGDRVLDTVTQPLGLRSFHFDPKRGFSLNGAAYPLHGICLHQDWGDKGWAVAPEQEKQDTQILREMGVNGLRLVHYQHSQTALDLYDRTGMIVWSELAQFGMVSPSQAYKQNVRQQLTEMIRQNYNHPSIAMWSMFNELNSKVTVTATPLIAELSKLAHTEDPGRPTVGASSGDTISHMHDMVASLDLVALNDYPGWYFGAPEDMNGEIEKWNAQYDSRGLAISEYGGGAKVGDHQQNLKPGDVKPYGWVQPEEWQASVHEGNYAAIKSHPAVWGSFIWLAFDSGGIPDQWGNYYGGNIKGMVTQDRKVRKDAYFFYQANWTSKPMLYLTSRRDTKRTEAMTPVKVYSNAASVSLTINGKSYGEQKPDTLHVFRWAKVSLDPGENHVEIKTPDGLHDEATWTLTPGASAAH